MRYVPTCNCKGSNISTFIKVDVIEDICIHCGYYAKYVDKHSIDKNGIFKHKENVSWKHKLKKYKTIIKDGKKTTVRIKSQEEDFSDIYQYTCHLEGGSL